MKNITEFELQVMLDALHGSLRLHDRVDAPLFQWTSDQRLTVLNGLYARMQESPEYIPVEKP